MKESLRKPWNRPDYPIWSLATKGKTPSMNICTYVIPITLTPKHFIIGVYKNTQTLQNITDTDYSILQLFSKNQQSLVAYLGKQSGKKKDKYAYVTKKGFTVLTHEGVGYIKESASVLVLKKIKNLESSLDHDIYLFKVEKTLLNNATPILTLQDLIQAKIIL